MKKNILFLILLLTSIICAAETKFPHREIRAVWLTTINGLDWPDAKATSTAGIARQKKELTEILDQLQKANINTVLLQTRIRATSIFPSTEATGCEPWDRCLTGTNGRDPGYDPLQYAIEECHRRGMELHAWLVTIPIGKWNDAGSRHLRRHTPETVMRIGDEAYMNPTSPQTAEYLSRYCRSITEKYDIDGIHLDYIRYPETIKHKPNADKAREHITTIMEHIYRAVKQEKAWVKVSCSPIGKHDDTRLYSSRGWNARSRVYQDVKEWMRKGIVDIVFPMMYFRGNDFYPFLADWQEARHKCTIVPGLGIYLLHHRERGWALNEITRQIHVSRQMQMGYCIFRSRFFTDNTKGIYTYVCHNVSPYPALPLPLCNHPAPPEAPSLLDIIELEGRNILRWKASPCPPGSDYLTYNIYASDSYPVDTKSPQNLIIMRYKGTALTIPEHRHSYYAITAMDRYGNESTPQQLSLPLRQQEHKPAWYWVTQPIKSEEAENK